MIKQALATFSYGKKQVMAHSFVSNKLWYPKREPLAQHESLITALLESRGITCAQHDDWLHPALSRLQSPFSMKGVLPATERLWQAFQKQEIIGIYTDFDLDGSCAVTLLYEGLSALGFKNLILEQPSRLEDGYGFHEKNVVTLQKKGASLLITADVGINGFSACQRARALGVDVIITDHHQVKQDLPEALAIINPNQKDCRSGLGYLCGAGVAFYLLRALARQWTDAQQSFDPGFLNTLLDVLALAILADMVPLIGDNRILAKKGLKALQQTRRPGLRYLLRQLQLHNKDLSTKDIGLKIAPKLNALSRLELSFRPAELLLVTDEAMAQTMVEQALLVNEERLRLQKEAEAIAMKLIESSPEWKDSQVYVIGHKSFHPGVVGLVATTLARKWAKPSFVAYQTKDGHWKGSGRNPEGFPISLLIALEHVPPDILKAFGGHMAACGFECVSEDMLPKLAESLNCFYREQLASLSLHELSGYYDFELPVERWSLESVQAIESLEPFGPGFETPRFFFQSLIIHQGSRLNHGGLKAQIWGQKDQPLPMSIEILSFNHPAQAEQLWWQAHHSGQSLDCVGSLQINRFRGQERLQLIIEDLRLHG